MPRRNNSNRLSRSKSTSSVHSKHESIDPAVARQHAHTAATLAFARAQERNSADIGHSGNGLPQPLSQQTNSANVDRVIKRQHSVRFAGPNAVQRRRSIGSRAAHHAREESSSANLRPVAITTNAAVPAAYRPPSRSSSIGKGSVSKATAESLLAVAQYSEYYTNEEDAPSTPSSYRRLRRSKSMFSPLKAPSVFYSNGTPDQPESSYLGNQNSASYSRTPQSPPAQVALRAPKSMSFLRGGRARPTYERNDEAVQLARDRFFQETAQQRVREQPSFLFRSKAQRQEKPFRKSVRTSSTNSYDVPISSGIQSHPSMESSLKGAARRASKNIKNKLRRVFGRSKEEPVAVPNQQVEARETHVRKYNGDPDMVYQEFSNIPHPDEAAFSRVASRIPSLHIANSDQQLRSYAGSVKSVKSSKSGHSDEKSRVTSWNSTGVNTVVSQNARPHIDREQQRLSVINEIGTHVPSSSFIRQKVANQFSASAIHRPSKIAGHFSAPGPGVVDSARVYSALMKRLDESSPKAEFKASHKASVESSAVSNRVPLRSSYVGSSRGHQTPATIRHVLLEDSTSSSQSYGPDQHEHHWARADSVNSARAEDIFGPTGSHVHQWVAADPLRQARMKNSDDVFSPKDDSGNKENISIEQPRERRQLNTSPSTLSRQASTKTSYHTVPESLGLTPQELAVRNEPVLQGTKVLREARSTFFGGTIFTIARTTSPFRRAMAEGSGCNSMDVANDFPLPSHASPLRNPLYLGPGAMASVDTIPDAASESGKAYSESIYSRTTSGQTPAAANSAQSLPITHKEIPEMPFPRTSTGDVVIIDRTTYRPVMPSGGSHRVTNSTGSIEWKKWMSSEVAKLERSKENTHAPYINYALPTMPKSFHPGHVREPAQMDDDDVEVAQPSVCPVKQPLGLLQQQNPNIPSVPLLKPILKNRSTVSLVESVDLPNGGNPAIPIPPPPPIPIRSPLRPIPSKSSLRSVATVNTSCTTSAPNSAVKISSLSGRHLLHKRNGSQTTLRSTKSASIKSAEIPAKLVKRTGRPFNANTPSPGGMLAAATERQFGSTSTASRYRTPGMVNNENIEAKDDIYGIEGAGLLGPRVSTAELEAQALGSKRMVDLFLSSRRRRIAGGSEESGAVFL
jgi:hypothetical protein